MHIVADILARAMSDGFMRGKVFIRAEIEAAFVGMQATLARDIRGDYGLHVGLVGDRDMECADVTAALDQCEDRAVIPKVALLNEGAALTLWRGTRVVGFAEIGFVGLHDLALASHWREIKATTAHCFHDAMVEKPSGVVLAAERAVQLVRAK